MDFADVGSETTEMATNAAIAAVQRQAKQETFPAIGRCYNCEASVKARPFCDAECRDDFERVLKARNRR